MVNLGVCARLSTYPRRPPTYPSSSVYEWLRTGWLLFGFHPRGRLGYLRARGLSFMLDCRYAGCSTEADSALMISGLRRDSPVSAKR